MFLGQIGSRYQATGLRIGPGLAENMYDNVAVLVLQIKTQAFVYMQYGLHAACGHQIKRCV